ncbi:MAG: DUF4870 domain-containing protein [Crocinitomicaceae bacterium]|nr:DUF4870 domain-containing protein [Crocinitomicaceae bacterium]
MASSYFNTYKPSEEEAEKASNGYLMSLVVIIVGLPLPLINLLATFIFFLMNRKVSVFVKWHCTQALLSQLVLFIFNSISFWWTISIFLGDRFLSSYYFAYLSVVIVVNIIEMISTIFAAIQTRKGRHVELFFFGPLTNLIIK